MKIELIRLDDYSDSPDNPRIMFEKGDKAFDEVNKSYDEFENIQPLIVNKRTKHYISGHLRKRVLKARGIEMAEAVIVDFDEQKERAAVIAMNKISGSWDFQKLANVLDEMSKIPDFDISITGFDLPEMSQIIDRYKEMPNDDDFEKEAGPIVEPITKKGDLIQLGQHRILCGDSSNPEDFKTLMGDEKADLLDCDFPYNVNYMGGDRPDSHTRPKKSKQWEQIYSDNMPQKEYELWMQKVLTNIKNHLKPGGVFYIWQGHREIPPTYNILLELGFHVGSLICWLKESAAISYADFSFRSEHALYGWLEGAPHYFAGKPGSSNVWEVHRDLTKEYSHPTQKPCQLGAMAVKFSSRKNEIVLDTFLGSGNLMLACELLDRRCYGLELSEKYCDLIVKKYCAYAPQKVSSEIKHKYLKEN